MARGNGTGPQPIHVEEKTEAPIERVARYLTSWRAIAGAVVALLAVLGTAVAYASLLARKTDVDAAIAAHEKLGVAPRAALVGKIERLEVRTDDHDARLRLLEEARRADERDRWWIMGTLREMARRQRIDVPEPPARTK